MRRFLLAAGLCLVIAPPPQAARQVSPARVGDARFAVRVVPESGHLTVEATMSLAPPPGEAGDVLTLLLRDDMQVVSASVPEGRLEVRQGGGVVRFLLDPPAATAVKVRLTLDGVPAEPRRGPYLTPTRALLPGAADWLPRGVGGRLTLSVDVPEGWTALGTGLGLGDDLKPAFGPVDFPVEGPWLLAEPGLVVRTASDPVPFILAGPGEVDRVVTETLERTSRTLGALRERLGPLPGRSVLLVGLDDLDEPLSLPGAVVAPFARLRQDLEMGQGDLSGLIAYWWGGHVAVAADEDPRWMAGFAAGLAAEIARAANGPRPAVLASLDDAHWRLDPARRVPLVRVDRRTPDAAVLVPAAGILQSFALHVGQEAFDGAVRVVTERFGGRRVGLRAFTEAIEEAAGVRAPFFAPWIERAGPADLRVTWDAAPVGDQWDVTVEIHQDAPPVPLPVEVTLSGTLANGRPDSIFRVLRSAETFRSFPLRLAFEPARVDADPDARLYRWTSSGRALARRAEELREAGRLADRAGDLVATDAAGAGELVEKALAIDPNHPGALLARARLLLARREVEASREVALRVSRAPLDPDYADLPWARAWAEVIVGRGWDLRRDRKQALEAYGRALALPDGRGAHRAAREGVRAPFQPSEPAPSGD